MGWRLATAAREEIRPAALSKVDSALPSPQIQAKAFQSTYKRRRALNQPKYYPSRFPHTLKKPESCTSRAKSCWKSSSKVRVRFGLCAWSTDWVTDWTSPRSKLHNRFGLLQRRRTDSPWISAACCTLSFSLLRDFSKGFMSRLGMFFQSFPAKRFFVPTLLCFLFTTA